MSTSAVRRAPKSSLAIPILLGIVLVPLSQIALGYLSGRGGSLLPWLVGTLISYFLIGGLGAFATVRGLVPALARRRGSFAGLMAGIAGACSSAAILAAIAVWSILAPPQSALLLHPHAGVTPRLFYAATWSPALPLIALILFFFPLFFLPINLLGIGLAPLGGMLGGYLRARLAQNGTSVQEQTGEQEGMRPAGGIVIVSITAVLLAIIIAAAGYFYATGTFPLIQSR